MPDDLPVLLGGPGGQSVIAHQEGPHVAQVDRVPVEQVDGLSDLIEGFEVRTGP
jgi:hypothetical protein